MIGRSAGTYDKSQQSNIETLEITCETTLLEKQFAGAPGKMFRGHCPNCSGDSKDSVFGTEIYHPQSSICKAAQHSGAIPKGKGGSVIISLIGPKPIFNGSEGEDHSFSATFAAADKSFMIKKALPIQKVNCSTTAQIGKFSDAPTNSQFVVMCPKMCSMLKDEIYGTEAYTENSSICIAAIHRGIINDRGGEARFIIQSGRDNYKGSNGFGVISKESGPNVRSFQFLGVKAAIYFSYKENYKGKFETKWMHEKHAHPRFSTKDNWDFFINPHNMNAEGKMEKIEGIRHTGKITAETEMNYGSWITLRNSEWANGTVKFNLMFKDKNPVAFFFRYKDRHNYYAVQFDQGSSVSNIRLLSRVEGK